MGHQEGDVEARRCAYQGGDPIHRIPKIDFESNSQSRTTSASN
jgi:hypothetical protein